MGYSRMQIRRCTKRLQKSKKRTRRLRKKHTGGAGVAFGPPRPPNPVNDALFLRAVRDGNLDEVRRLLATGLINVDAQDELIQPQFNFNGGPNVRRGMTPLFFAVSRNMHHLPFVQQYGIVDEAAKDNYYQIAELLIQRGANVNATTAEWFRGWSPIHWAAEYWNLDMIQLLMSNGARKDPRYQINAAGETWNIVNASFREHEYEDDIRAHINHVGPIMRDLHQGL